MAEGLAEGDYFKQECVSKLPRIFKSYYIGLSIYTFETFEDNICGEIKTKREPVPFINENYKDGTCIKTDFLVNEGEILYA